MAKADIRVKIGDPDSFRRIILASALDSAKLLKTPGELQKIKMQKQALKRKLLKTIKEIKTASNSIDANLPELEGEFKKARIVKRTKKAAATKSQKPSTLQQEFEEIERKLKELQ